MTLKPKRGCLFGSIALLTALVVIGVFAYNLFASVFSPFNQVASILNKEYSVSQILTNPITSQDLIEAKSKFDGCDVFNSQGNFDLNADFQPVIVDCTLTGNQLAALFNNLYQVDEYNYLRVKQFDLITNADNSISIKIIYEFDLTSFTSRLLNFVVYLTVDYIIINNQVVSAGCIINQTSMSDTKIVINNITDKSYEEFCENITNSVSQSLDEFADHYYLNYEFFNNQVRIYS